MELKGKKNLTSISIIATLIVIVFSGGYLLGQNQVICDVCPPEDLDFSLFWEAYHRLKEMYVEPEKIDNQQVVYGAISGMLESLGDPYTIFLDPEDNQQFKEDISGRFEGVGMEIGIRNNQLQVIAPLEGTPAQKAGLLPGDKIIEINGQFTTNMTLDEAVSLIRGQKGTIVTLTIFREEWKSPKDIEIRRGVIEIPSLKWEILEEDIAHIELYQFSEKAGLDFSWAVLRILASDTERIILDLRNNPGGYLEVARDIASFFLKKGDLVVIEDYGEEQTEYRTTSHPLFLDYPVVVLINQGSASGSEILAGALRDNRGILLIGEVSFGKGSVQQLETLRGGSSIKVTTAKWLTPKGETIEGVGLEPDIVVEMTEEDYLEGRDPQLDKAIEVIKEL